MKISNFEYYKNLYSDCYESHVTIKGKYTGVFAKVVPVMNSGYFEILIGEPNRGTLQYKGTVKGLRKSKFKAKEWLLVSAKNYL